MERGRKDLEGAEEGVMGVYCVYVGEGKISKNFGEVYV